LRLAGVALLALACAAHGAAFELAEVAPGVYVHLGRPLPLDVPGHDDIANIGFVVGRKCVAVIDTGGSLRTGRELRAAIRARSALPVCYVIDTHVHVDHVLGNLAFKDDRPTFVGHVALAQAIDRNRSFFLEKYPADLGVPPNADQIIGPDKLVEHELTLDLGDRPLRLRAWPKAHSDCDLTVLDQRTSTLWTGDLVFRERLPALDGSLTGWLAALDELGAWKVALAIPGHGPPAHDLAGAIGPERAYLLALADGVRRELAQGSSMQDAIAHVAFEQKAGWLLWDDVHPRNVARAYEELEWEK
jgi:quinoprotein relay system zinc metallohydrolase 2